MAQDDYLEQEVSQLERKGYRIDPYCSKERDFGGVNASLPDAFVNDYEPQIGIKTEKARHRLCVYMYAGGATHQEIAEQTGYTAAHVSNILRQPWARLRMQTEIREAGQAELHRMLSVEGPAAVQRLIDLSKTATKEAVRAQANIHILDRIMGKAVQPFRNDDKPAEEMADAEIQRRIEERLATHNAN